MIAVLADHDGKHIAALALIQGGSEIVDGYIATMNQFSQFLELHKASQLASLEAEAQAAAATGQVM